MENLGQDARSPPPARPDPSAYPPDIFQLAVLLDGYRDEFGFAYRWQQILLSRLLSAVAAWGRRRGYRATYPPAR